MSRVFLLGFILSLFSLRVEAKLNNLVGEMKKESQLIVLANESIKFSKLSLEQIEAKHDWNININLSHHDNYRDALLSFQELRTINDTLSLGVQKTFSWGGQLKIEQLATRYNLSKWGARSAAFTGGGLLNDNPYEFSSRLTYSQDLGRNFFGTLEDLDLDIIQSEIKLREKERDYQIERSIEKLTRLYTQGRLLKSLVSTTKKTLSRYKKRLNLVKKRVADGLKLEVDLLQVKSEHIKQKEQLINYQDQLENVLSGISLILERSVYLKEIKKYNKSNHLIIKNTSQWKVLENLEISKAKLRLKSINLALKKSKRLKKPQVKLEASFATNAIEDNFSQSFKKGSVNSHYQSKSVSLNVVIPLGNKLAKVDTQRKKSQKYQEQIQIDLLNKELAIKANSILKRVNFLRKKIATGKKRLDLSHQVVSRYEKLYLQGRVSIDILLSAEDRLNLNEIEFFNTRLAFEQLMLDYAIITNHLNDFLKAYKD